MGACPACDGLGEKLLFDPQLVVPNEALSLKQGAVVPWAKSNPPSPYYMQVLSSLAAEFGFSLEAPWQDLPVDVRIVILHGTADKATKYQGSQFFFETAGSADKTLKLYEGHFHDLLADTGKEEVLADIAAWIEARA